MSQRKAVVVGAGPVGCLAALALGKRGWSVDIYEGRPDLRLPSSKAAAQQRSINLAISHRGIAAMHAIDAATAQRFLHSAIPMRGRMIHKQTGELDSQLYDRDGQASYFTTHLKDIAHASKPLCINSIDRAVLNEGLLEEADASPNIRVFFNHKVISADFDHKTITVRDVLSSREEDVNFDFCIGADGSYSVIRRQMMRVVRMDYHQEYIRDEYVELKMPAGRSSNGEPTFLLDPNHLHIWPRSSFMLIALPNKDKTFTCTLFAPSAELDRLNNADTILSWFKLYFPDAVRAIGEKILVDDFLRNPRSALVHTESNPYHYEDRVIILGDAAHSMVPFYGQGLNCGLEDVRILSVLLAEEGVQSDNSLSYIDTKNAIDPALARALERYSATRHDDLVAICKLAMDNYVEMRHSVITMPYLVKKTLDNVLYSLSSKTVVSLGALAPILSRSLYSPVEPSGWLPLYTMVTFRPDISYAAVQKKAARQGRILTRLCGVGGTLLGALGGYITWSAWKALMHCLSATK
ncbi:FAD/NAD(P)-binding domain-containing protein [Crucibulum laeve]|uniref:Kynurenine 3-monooxygenase n=1 Tax=Crucibulum laeve TaxID=68775 RepID=A0A5C3MD44_9AGAR|nr:FAD/NAD(P)-binding domain-containing protein [Crucibulum laeve]